MTTATGSFSLAKGFRDTPAWIYLLVTVMLAAGVVCLRFAGWV